MRFSQSYERILIYLKYKKIEHLLMDIQMLSKEPVVKHL